MEKCADSVPFPRPYLRRTSRETESTLRGLPHSHADPFGRALFRLSSAPAAVTANELAVGICVDKAARRARPLIGLQIEDHMRT
jgi:hypothetical protein